MADSARALPTQSSVDRPGESHYVGDEHNSDEEMFPSGSHGEVSQLIDPGEDPCFYGRFNGESFLV